MKDLETLGNSTGWLSKSRVQGWGFRTFEKFSAQHLLRGARFSAQGLCRV